MYEKDSALNNQQWLICHKTKPNSLSLSIYIYIHVVDKGVND